MDDAALGLGLAFAQAAGTSLGSAIAAASSIGYEFVEPPTLRMLDKAIDPSTDEGATERSTFEAFPATLVVRGSTGTDD